MFQAGELLEEPARAPGPSIVDALVCPDDTAAFLASMVPSSDVGGPLAVLDPRGLSAAGRVDLLVALERQVRWLTARQQHVLSAMLDSGGPGQIWDPDGDHFVQDEVACALTIAGVTAHDRLSIASELTGRLRDTLVLFEAGLMSYWHAKILAGALTGFDDEVARTVQARVLPRATGTTPAEFRDVVRRVIRRLDRRDAEKRHREATLERRVAHTPTDDGMAEIWALAPADGAAIVMAAIQAWSSPRDGDDTRTADQRRADALVEICCSALHDPLVPRAHGARPAVQVTVAASTLLELDDEPGELAGYGPIPAALARRIAVDPTGTWRRIVLDDVGRLLDYGRRTYRPPQSLADHVIARDRFCCFPGCRRPAARCHLDHRVPFPLGPTSAQNLQPLCPHHHLLKHRAGWDITRNQDGGYTWRSPTRHRYQYRPPRYPSTAAGLAVPVDHDPPPF